MNNKEYPKGMVECGSCDGKSATDKRIACEECGSAGYIECEHWEYGDHNDCLTCGYDRTPDLMDEAENRVEGER